jgi:hypothetical protein
MFWYLDNFAYDLRAVFTEALQCLIDVVNGEHDAEIAKSVYRRTAVVRDDRRLG